MTWSNRNVSGNPPIRDKIDALQSHKHINIYTYIYLYLTDRMTTTAKPKEDATTQKQNNAAFTKLVSRYLDSNPAFRKDSKTNEFEIRFNSSGGARKPFTKIHFDNVVKHLYSAGFETRNPDGEHMLRVIPEYVDRKTTTTKMSNIRAEIHGMDLIQEYCRTNDLKKLNELASGLSNKLSFTQKQSDRDETGAYVKPVDFADFNFRVSYQLEQSYGLHTRVGKDILDRWTESKKIFRLMNRIRFSHPTYPVYADLSIVKTSRRTNRVMIPEYTIQDAGVFTNPEEYEIELEINNSAVGAGTSYSTVDALMDGLRKSIRVVLSGLQGTNYPISNTEQSEVLQEYMRILNGDYDGSGSDAAAAAPETTTYRVSNKNFIGPGITTLQMENVLVPTPETAVIPNIRNQYCVTEKADGDRKLLYVSDTGRIYLIDTNMNVVFTGMKTEDKVLWLSILDGEHIKYDSKKRFIDLYTAFDIYYIHKTSVREFAFLPDPDAREDEMEEGEILEGGGDGGGRMERGTGEKRAKSRDAAAGATGKGDKPKYRLPLLHDFVSRLQPVPIYTSTDEKAAKRHWKTVLNKKGETTWIDMKTGAVSKTEPAPYKCKMRIQCKNFAVGSSTHSIFEKCSEILSNIKGGQYEYLTDGLIFTPINTGVGSDRIGVAAPLKKTTWDRSFKWKPAEQNTIDFLVSVKKDNRGKDEIHTIFQDGRNLTGVQDIVEYKTLVLRCGFSEKNHTSLNPCADIIHDRLPSPDDIDNEDTYRPEPFYPTNPYDMKASLCNVRLNRDGNIPIMMTEEGQYFEEDMIVEFRYEMANDVGWRWIPLRVRYDKTGALRAGAREYGNAYHVANNNWHSLHNPITEAMIRTGEGIPTAIIQEDSYYNRTDSISVTRGLRDFHNRFVKDRLIAAVSNRGDTLIDYAVGAGGDLSKWIRAKLGFVFGIDLSKYNIYNERESACARYVEERKKRAKMPDALFVNGNSAINIRTTGAAFFGDKDKEIAKAIFGNGPKDATILGKGVYKQYGVGQEGFHVSSAMFCVHYFCENMKTFLGFMQNLAECTRLNGYFIGTCYDGKTVFKSLEGVPTGESSVIMKQGKKIHEIEKAYDFTSFPDNELSLGYKINVYYETINKMLAEYLVNFAYMTQIAEMYGFVLVSKEEAQTMGLPNGTGMFGELYAAMEAEVKQDNRSQANFGRALSMTTEERAISFLNRFFVFRKMRNVNTEKITKLLMKKQVFGEDAEEEDGKGAEDAADTEIKEMITTIAKQTANKGQGRAKSRKLKKKIVLDKYSPPADEDDK